jgi:glycosyltransferase EpsD
VAEFIPRKDHAFLIEQVKRLHDGPLPDIRLLLLGQGELEEKIKSEVRGSGMEAYVSFLGYRTDVNEVCAAADLLVSASAQEGLPMNIMEAMATGIPVVCTDIRGQRDLITDGRNGYLFSRGDAEAFARHVIRLLGDDSLRDCIGRQNRLDAGKYSLECAIGAMAAIYERYV